MVRDSGLLVRFVWPFQNTRPLDRVLARSYFENTSNHATPVFRQQGPLLSQRQFRAHCVRLQSFSSSKL